MVRPPDGDRTAPTCAPLEGSLAAGALRHRYYPNGRELRHWRGDTMNLSPRKLTAAHALLVDLLSGGRSAGRQ